MHTSRALLVVLSLVPLFACATSGGDKLTSPTTLHTADGHDLSLDTLLGEKPATVLIWWSSTCPCVKRYERRVADLAARLPAFAFFHVASNADDGSDELAAARAPLPILHDPTGTLASRLGVRSTPTVVVLDPGGEVLYRGWLDNEHDLGDPDREPWLEDALARIGRGETTLSQTPTWGCTVTRSLSQAGRCTHPR